MAYAYLVVLFATDVCPFYRTPSTPSTYKANVNRTKTRKWVEAKTQNYDGDDWGNDYEDEYDEPEPEPESEREREPEPEPPSTSRVAALRQNFRSQSRSPSQPPAGAATGAADSSSTNAPGSSDVRRPSSPPSLHIQTGASSRVRPTDGPSSAQGVGSGSSRYPPRKSSMSQEASDSDAGAPISGSRPESASSGRPSTNQRAASPTIIRPADIYRRIGEEREKERRSMESGRPSTDSARGRNDGASSPVNAARSSIEQRRRTSFESHDGSDSSRGLKQTLAPVEERKSEYGMDRLLGNNQERPLSTSPKLPDLTRLSGFGDDFFSTGGHSSSARPSLSPIPDSQQPDITYAKPGLGDGSGNKRRDTADISEEGKHAPSALEGPKLQPNPNIIMPSSDGGSLDPSKKDPVDLTRKPVLPRPQLPGTWVSETVSIEPTSTETAKGLGPASLGSSANPRASPMSSKHAEPVDIEPTTTVRHLPSPRDDSEAAAINKIVRESGGNSFDSPTGKHDNAVASKVIASGPGYHPTPQSLPPLKTDNPLASSNIARKDKQAESRSNDMAPPSTNYKQSPTRLSPTRPSATSSAQGFTPTAPLNPRRSTITPADVVTPTIQERKSTMSTVDTASPEKESDKLREEIIKSLSASPATTPNASAILGSARGGPDPVPGELSRESTYLSDIYDNYLAPAEEKSLRETGQILKQAPKLASHGTEKAETHVGSNLQKENAFPDIAPLSPHRSPKQANAPLPRRFSWEESQEKIAPGTVEAKPDSSASPSGSNSNSQNGQEENDRAPVIGPDATVTSPGSLQVQSERPDTISHQVSQVSSRAPGDLAVIESPSPVSAVEKSPTTQGAALEPSRLSFADEKEKVLIQSSSNASSAEQHPALDQPLQELAPSPIIQPTTPAQSAPQAKITAFRDILNIVTIEQRIEKFDETRNQFYAMESGLTNWISYMQSQPEHGAIMSGQPGQTSPSGVQPPTQQPYYQQYLNASNPGAPPGQPTRTPSGNLQQMLKGQPTSSFGASGNQVGAKSKELLQAAGSFGNKGMKSGMKLFNKGKNKLRGTGDKVFS